MYGRAQFSTVSKVDFGVCLVEYIRVSGQTHVFGVVSDGEGTCDEIRVYDAVGNQCWTAYGTDNGNAWDKAFEYCRTMGKHNNHKGAVCNALKWERWNNPFRAAMHNAVYNKINAVLDMALRIE